MTFEAGSDDLRCRDCDAPITRQEYQRKVSRCNECEAAAVIAVWRWPGEDEPEQEQAA